MLSSKIIHKEVIFMLLKDALKEFLLECKLRQYSDRTIQHEKNSNTAMFTYVEREYGITKIEDLKHIHMKGYIQYLVDLQRKETYVNGLIKSFRAFFKYCVEEDYISTNPALKLSFQKEETPMILTFTDDEVVRLVNYYKGTKFLTVRNKLIMAVMCIRYQDFLDIKI